MAICEWKECKIEELKAMKKRVYMLLSVTTRLSASEFMRNLKVKMANGVFKN
jgi:REP element-mobilizing transposase RayT